MTRLVRAGAALPVVVVDPDSRPIFAGASLPVTAVEIADGPIQFIQFQTDPPAQTHVEGKIFWDEAEGTLSVMTNVDGVVVQVGEESQVLVRNDTGSTIPNGAAVYVNGIAGGRPSIALAQADDLTTLNVIGIATEAILGDGLTDGRVTAFGLVRTIDTSAFSPNDVIWLSGSVAGGLTATRPTFPDFTLRVGRVIVSDATNGKIFVAIRSPDNIGEFASLYVNNGVAAQSLTAATEAKMTAFTAVGPSQIIIPDLANDEIAAFEAGVHQVASQVSFTSSTNNTLFEFKFAVNGVSSVLAAQRFVSTGADVGSASFTGQLNLAASDDVSINVEADGNTNITILEAQLNLFKL